MFHRGLFIFPTEEEISGDLLMSDRIIQTISVPRGGKMDLFLQDARKAGKNLSALVCGIVERHSSLYDDNVEMELELLQLRHRYALVCQAAKLALSKNGEEWEIYFPSDETLEMMKYAPGENYGMAGRIHFRKVDSAL